MDSEGNDLFVITQFNPIKIDAGDFLAVNNLSDLVNLIVDQRNSHSIDEGRSV